MKTHGRSTPLTLPIRLAIAAALVGGLPHAQGLFVEGQPMPGLELPTIDGRSTVDLASLGGARVIVLQFASW